MSCLNKTVHGVNRKKLPGSNTSFYKVDTTELLGLSSKPLIDELSVRKASIKYLATRASLWMKHTKETQKPIIEHLTLLEEKLIAILNSW